MLYIPQSLKRCTRCDKWKPSTTKYFPKTSRDKTKLNSWCRQCYAKKSSKWYQENYEYGLERIRLYSESHREQSRARALEYGRHHRESVNRNQKNFRKRHPERTNEWRNRRRAKKRLLPATFTEQQWKTALTYWDNRCAYCGRPRGLWHRLAQDHFISQDSGGGYIATNIVPACHGTDGCNNKKSNKHPDQWLAAEFGQKKAKQILASIYAYFDWLKAT